MKLDSAAPLRSLRLLESPPRSHAVVGASRVPSVSDAAVIHAEQAGARIRVETLMAYAEALGYTLELVVHRKDSL